MSMWSEFIDGGWKFWKKDKPLVEPEEAVKPVVDTNVESSIVAEASFLCSVTISYKNRPSEKDGKFYIDKAVPHMDFLISNDFPEAKLILSQFIRSGDFNRSCVTWNLAPKNVTMDITYGKESDEDVTL